MYVENVDLLTFVIKCRNCRFTHFWVNYFGQKSASVKSLTNMMSGYSVEKKLQEGKGVKITQGL